MKFKNLNVIISINCVNKIDLGEIGKFSLKL